MVAIPEPAKDFLRGTPLAHVTTLDPDGGPQVTVAWVELDGDDLLIATVPEQRKLRNMRRDPRVALSFEATTTNPMGLREYLVVYGRAEVTAGGAPELLGRMAQRYLGPGVTFPPMPNPPEGFVTRVTPTRIGGVGPWMSEG